MTLSAPSQKLWSCRKRGSDGDYIFMGAWKGWLGKVVVYVEDPKKTENPAFYGDAGLTGQQGQSLEDVISYAVNERKTTDTGETACRAREGEAVKQAFCIRYQLFAADRKGGDDGGEETVREG